MSSIVEAASVLLGRGPGSAEVFVVRRAGKLRFFGGFYAFPGGTVTAADAACLSLLRECDAAATASEQIRRITAARELFEETGVLLARQADGSFPASGPELDHLRREMMEDRRTFGEILAQLGLQLRVGDLIPVASRLTPPYAPVRYDTTFFVAEVPSHQQPTVWPGELDEGEWVTARGLWEKWLHGEWLVSPPALRMAEVLGDRPLAEAPSILAERGELHAETALVPIFFAPAVAMIPLHTMALLPSTHTNAFLVGRDPAYLLDPGTTDAEEQERLFHVLDRQRAAGVRLKAVVLTHHHPDHVGAADACARRYRVPIWAHPVTAQLLSGRVVVQREIHDGEELDLGTAPDGSGPWSLRAIHTPGHAPGHLAFYEARYRLLFAGDMVSTLTSIIIAPPEGDLTEYLDSLRRLRDLDCRLLLPSHGSPSARPATTLEEAIAHRVKREEQLLAALGSEPRTVPDLAVELYKGLPASHMRFAELQLLAGLHKLEREGHVETMLPPTGEGWRLRTAAS